MYHQSVKLIKKEIYSLMSFSAINSKLQSSEPRDKNKQKTTKKDATQPISTSKNNVLTVKFHDVLKCIIIHTICNCIVLLLKKSFQILYTAQCSATKYFCSVVHCFFFYITENSDPAKLKKKKKSTSRIRQYTENESCYSTRGW